MKVAVLGLGIMGAGMARQLLARGFDVSVWNRSAGKAAPLGTAGARIAASPADAAHDAEFVHAMLADDGASRAVWTGEQGALGAMRENAIAIESGTLSVEWMRELAATAAARGIGFLDAPVTGSKAQAESGALSFLVGGPQDVLERARPMLSAMGGNIIHLGSHGNGAMMKLINNFMCGVQVASLAEAIGMASRSGLDVAQAAQVLASGSPGSPLVRNISQRMVQRDYSPNFFVRLMVKDMEYARAAFARAGIELASAGAARERFLEGMRAGFGDRDIASIAELLRG